MTGGLPRPATGPELAVLRHPDRRSAWAVLAVADLAAAATPAEVGARLARLAAAAPIVTARLSGSAWVPGDAAALQALAWDPAAGAAHAPAGLVRRFDLSAEPPVRVALSADGRRLAVAAHHAALDGLGLAAVVAALAADGPPPAAHPGGPTPAPPGAAAGDRRLAAGPLAGAGSGQRESDRGRGRRRRRRSVAVAAAGESAALAARLLRPADRVAPDPATGGWSPDGTADAVAARSVELPPRLGSSTTARLAAAAAEAAGAHNRQAGARWRRVGLSVGVGSPAGVVPSNAATYVRLDVSSGTAPDALADALGAALRAAGRSPALEQRHRLPPGALVAPLARRLSDSLLVSNLGRLDLPGVARLAFFPVARGRSAVAVGCATVGAGPAVVTLRARDLGPASAAALLDDLVAALA